MLNMVTKDTFSGYLGQKFHVHVAAAVLDMELVDVNELVATVGRRSTKPSAQGPRPFSVLFQGPQDPLLPQATYKVEHEAVGTVDIFIVPIGPEQGVAMYEGIFN